MELFFRELGQGQPLIFLHGIFGSSDNWLTQSRMLSSSYHTYALDMRNHGQSAHHKKFDYPSMAGDLLAFIDKHAIQNPVVIGHSMGGKVAMNFAIEHPDRLSKLIVVDIAPKAYNMRHDTILEGLLAIPINEITTRNEADEALAAYVEEPDVRMFLLKNLQRNPEGGFRWKLNLDAIADNIENIGVGLQVEGIFEKPVLFLRGKRSKYVGDEDLDHIHKVFPKAEIETFDTGHWLPAEKPEEFVEKVRQWVG